VLTPSQELQVTSDRLESHLKNIWMFLGNDDKLKIKEVKWLLLSIAKRIREDADISDNRTDIPADISDTLDTSGVSVTGADNE